MDLSILIWVGAVMAVIGLAGLGYCIRDAAKIKGANLPPEQIHARLQRLVVINIAAVGVAFFGLAMIAFALIAG